MEAPFCIETDARTPIIRTTIDELTSTLDELFHAYFLKTPTSVGITEEGKAFGEGDQIGIGFGINGFGVKKTFIYLSIKPCDGEYYQSIGDPRAAGTIDYFVGFCTPVEVERSDFVPWPLALQAIREFVEFGRRASSIRWRDCYGREVS